MSGDETAALNLAVLDGILARQAAAGEDAGDDFDARVQDLAHGYLLLRGHYDLSAAETMRLHRILSPLARRHHGRPHPGGLGRDFVASYPRSGNTMTLRMLAGLDRVLVVADMPAAPRYSARALEGEEFPARRLCKTHRVPDCAPQDRCLFVFRDPRDLLPSLAYMTLKAGLHRFTERHEMTGFIDFLHDRYTFGSWLDFAQKALAMRGAPNVRLMRYDALDAGPEALAQAADFLGVPAPADRLRAAFEGRGGALDRIRANPDLDAQWGLGETEPPGSLYAAWMAARGGSSWQETLDDAARDNLKARGYGAVLIALGYAADADW